jgi:hypothetical protein
MNFNFHKGKDNYISNNNQRYQNNLLLIKDKYRTQNSLFSSKHKTNEIIDKIKMKYGLLHNTLNTQVVNRKIQILKNKYMKGSQNLESKININNNIRYSTNNDINNKLVLRANNNNKKHMFRSTSLQFVKENNLNFNNLYNTLKNDRKISFKENNKLNNIDFEATKNENNKANNTKSKFEFKYLKNIKEDFINIHNKFKNLFQNDVFNKKKKKLVNMIFPISKKLYLLSEMKKDIKIANKNSFRNMTISPKSTISSNSEYTSKNIFSELFSENGDDETIIGQNGIKKPNLIRTFSKPKLNVPKYRNLYNMKI